MKLFFATLIAFYLVILTFAQSNNTTATIPAPPNAGVAITSPTLNETVILGSNYTIRWSILDPNATTIEAIGLMYGNPAYLSLAIPNILTNESIPVSQLSYNWTVPTNLTNGTDYVITMFGNNSATTYSTFFSLQPGNLTVSSNSTI